MFAEQVKRTALVHDWLNQDGGAEVVLGALHEMFPAAPIFTAIADPARVPAIAAWDVRTSWMDRLPGVHRRHQPYLPLYPIAWDTTRLSGYDLVLSNKSGFCHGVRTNGAVHVCYCLTPTRYVWDPDAYLRFESVPPGTRAMLGALLPALRHWELAAARRVDCFVAISSVVRDRIARIYGRDSTVIFPPVPVDDYAPDDAEARPPDDFHLVLARLVPYKRIDLAIAAFNSLGRRLVIVGEGRDRPRLEALAGPTISFVGRRSAPDVRDLLSRCRGLVWPGVEDFGLAPVEAMASGRPVIALRAGGALDTVVEGRTGVFFDASEPEALAAAVARSDAVTWDAGVLRRHARSFSRATFERRLGDFVTASLAARHERRTHR